MWRIIPIKICIYKTLVVFSLVISSSISLLILLNNILFICCNLLLSYIRYNIFFLKVKPLCCHVHFLFIFFHSRTFISDSFFPRKNCLSTPMDFLSNSRWFHLILLFVWRYVASLKGIVDFWFLYILYHTIFL